MNYNADALADFARARLAIPRGAVRHHLAHYLGSGAVYAIFLVVPLDVHRKVRQIPHRTNSLLEIILVTIVTVAFVKDRLRVEVDHQRRDHDGDGGDGHQETCERRRQRHVCDGKQHTGSQGYPNHVVPQSPPQVHLNPAHDVSAEVDGDQDIREFVIDENDVRSLNRHVAPFTHCNAQVSLSESWGIVDAISYHQTAPSGVSGLPLFHFRSLRSR
eukprot:CAMPEP_0170176864 /NCGR_PEP_ID=MMETSP0040_2-20121228/9640_1 /TAXON_ID=641309 /ORGANISM="Lotharella oceanica, Strain CCMP622" /LENGTH=215 /DNA_ID=CAMNT_0010419315 /DNA_START=158 /DNA_END=806 /DNA_ORIENTATION=+